MNVGHAATPEQPKFANKLQFGINLAKINSTEQLSVNFQRLYESPNITSDTKLLNNSSSTLSGGGVASSATTYQLKTDNKLNLKKSSQLLLYFNAIDLRNTNNSINNIRDIIASAGYGVHNTHFSFNTSIGYRSLESYNSHSGITQNGILVRPALALRIDPSKTLPSDIPQTYRDYLKSFTLKTEIADVMTRDNSLLQFNFSVSKDVDKYTTLSFSYDLEQNQNPQNPSMESTRKRLAILILFNFI